MVYVSDYSKMQQCLSRGGGAEEEEEDREIHQTLASVGD